MKAHRSKLDQAETAATPNATKPAETVVAAATILDCRNKYRSATHFMARSRLTWPEAYANRQRPIEKHKADNTKNIWGKRLNQKSTHQGTRCLGGRLDVSDIVKHFNKDFKRTHYMAVSQIDPNRLFTVAAILKTRLKNQNKFTAFAVGLLS